MVLEQLGGLSLNDLILSLQEHIISFSRGIDALIGKNKALSTADIQEIRNHLKERLDKGAERAENEKLLKLVNLFSDDKKALDLIRTDIDDWIAFLDSIDSHIKLGRNSIEAEKLRREMSKLRQELRGNGV